ncbi:molybdate ABC transporter substrate-binding protein [Blastopirellula marina]|nr:molybdate ABC transporter substrate-binding protein [Blastopirellula marina]
MTASRNRFLLLAILVSLPATGCSSAESEPPLRVYCAAVMRKPIEILAEQYKAETGTQIELQFGGSNTLLSQLTIGGSGDLYLAADQSYIDRAQANDLTDQVIPIAQITPVVIAAKCKGLKIDSVEALTRGDLRIALADPDAAAIGRITKSALQKCGKWDQIAGQVQSIGVIKPTVGDVAGAVSLGSADVGIVWDTVGMQREDLQVFRLAELDDWNSTISVAVLKSSGHPARSLDFAEYLAHSPAALRQYSQLHFQTLAEADVETAHE